MIKNSNDLKKYPYLDWVSSNQITNKDNLNSYIKTNFREKEYQFLLTIAALVLVNFLTGFSMAIPGLFVSYMYFYSTKNKLIFEKATQRDGMIFFTLSLIFLLIEQLINFYYIRFGYVLLFIFGFFLFIHAMIYSTYDEGKREILIKQEDKFPSKFFPKEGDLILGKILENENDKKGIYSLVLPISNRKTHALVVGPTGSGKTSMTISPSIVQDIMSPNMGIILLEPKGDVTYQMYLFAKCLIEADRRNYETAIEKGEKNPYKGIKDKKAILVDVSDITNVPIFNPLIGNEEDVVSNLISAFANAKENDYWSDSLKKVLSYAIKLTKRANPDSGMIEPSMKDVEGLVNLNVSQVNELIARLKNQPYGNERENEDIINFFTQAMSNDKVKQQFSQAGLIITNLLKSPTVSRLLLPSEDKSRKRINLDESLKNNDMLFITVPSSAVGEDNVQIISSLLMMLIQSAVFRRGSDNYLESIQIGVRVEDIVEYEAIPCNEFKIFNKKDMSVLVEYNEGFNFTYFPKYEYDFEKAVLCSSYKEILKNIEEEGIKLDELIIRFYNNGSEYDFSDSQYSEVFNNLELLDDLQISNAPYCSIYLDEFQDYFNPNFRSFLQKARSYNAFVFLLTQAISQINSPKFAITSIENNARIKGVWGGVGTEEADRFSKLFGKKTVTKVTERKEKRVFKMLDEVFKRDNKIFEQVQIIDYFTPDEIKRLPDKHAIYEVVQGISSVKTPVIVKCEFLPLEDHAFLSSMYNGIYKVQNTQNLRKFKEEDILIPAIGNFYYGNNDTNNDGNAGEYYKGDTSKDNNMFSFDKNLSSIKEKGNEENIIVTENDNLSDSDYFNDNIQSRSGNYDESSESSSSDFDPLDPSIIMDDDITDFFNEN